ncbi:hypothetical protein WJS89_01035 [Sphingomicrobium sp. XHP0235]
MDIVAILVALVIAFVIWKFVVGFVKFALIAVVILVALFFVFGGVPA